MKDYEQRPEIHQEGVSDWSGTRSETLLCEVCSSTRVQTESEGEVYLAVVVFFCLFFFNQKYFGQTLQQYQCVNSRSWRDIPEQESLSPFVQR